MEQIHSLQQLDLDYRARNYILTYRDWWSYEDAVMMARNPLIRTQKSDKRWRPKLVKALKAAGIISKNIDKRDLSVFYLYVKTYMARPIWMTNHDELWSRLENECYEIACKGLPEGTFEKVVRAICKNLSDKKATIILMKYGFITGRVYRSYTGLRKRLPKEWQYCEEYLKTLENDALKELRDVLPPVFERVSEAYKLREEFWFHSKEKRKMKSIKKQLLEKYGIEPL